MANPNYVCTICSQTFTRKWRGTVHNNNIHVGLAKVVRLIDYIIGRSNGEYFPGDPSYYRRKRKMGDLTEHQWHLLEKVMGQESHIHQSGPHTAPARNQQYYVTDSRHSLDFIQHSEAMIKSAELKRLLSKYLSPKDVHDTLCYVGMNCMTLGDYRPLDKALSLASENAKLKEALDYLKAS
jgi:hypothetical protein